MFRRGIGSGDRQWCGRRGHQHQRVPPAGYPARGKRHRADPREAKTQYCGVAHRRAAMNADQRRTGLCVCDRARG